MAGLPQPLSNSDLSTGGTSSPEPELPPNSPMTSYPKSKIKVVLLENLHPDGIQMLKEEGFNVTTLTSSLAGDELKNTIRKAHLVGVRSKTKLTAEVLKECKRLKAVGCFCIGTDQTDLEQACSMGVPVFNSPYSNSRSVAELVISHIISLSRQVPNHVLDMHNGVWNKTAKNCCEIRGKTIGIVGYGHIGTQLGVMCESMGMKVIFYDIMDIMPLGNATPVSTLEELLVQSHYVTMHVPDTPQTRGMIQAEQLNLMREKSFFLNLSRGAVVNLTDLRAAIDSGHIAGCACDVYPKEPAANGELAKYPEVKIPLIGARNTILTPHIGGSTEEAQRAIGVEVASKLIRFLNLGLTESAVNFPQITPVPMVDDSSVHRILNIHRNVPGVMARINNCMTNLNIFSQQLRTQGSIGYLVLDLEAEISREVKDSLDAMGETILTRVLF